MQSESFFYFLWQVRDYPARNCSTERTINFSFIETENCIYACATINIQCKHGFLVQWRRVIHPKRLAITAIMRLLIFVTLDGKTYTNDFLFSNGFPFTSGLCQPFERIGHPFARNSPFEWLPHPLVRNINPFERLSYAFVRNIKLFKRLGTRLLKTSGRSNGVVICIMAFLCIFCRMTCMGDELRYSLKKIPLFERWFKSMFSRFVWLHLHKFIGFKLSFCPF